MKNPKRMPAKRLNYCIGHSGREFGQCGTCRRLPSMSAADAAKCGMCIHGYAPAEIAENNFAPRRGMVRP